MSGDLETLQMQLDATHMCTEETRGNMLSGFV